MKQLEILRKTVYELKYDTSGLTPFCCTGPKISPFLNKCEALSRVTKNLHVPVGVLNMVLGKHRPKAAGVVGELTEFHSERKRIKKIWFEKVKETNHSRYGDADGNMIFKCYVGSASTVVTMCTTHCTVKRSALFMVTPCINDINPSQPN